MRSDIEIAQAARLKPVAEVAARLGLRANELEPYGRYKAKVPLDVIERRGEAEGRLVLVTGINPTPAGEGKSTVSVGLGDALRQLGLRSILCLREPSLGPVFGMKGGATGGGFSQVVPMEDINLHFTGDFHAITTAHALLSALLDNHLQQGNLLAIDSRRITWKRAIDMNDRALRSIVVGLGGPTNGVPRQDGFMITAASEVMAIFALAANRADLEERLARIIVGYTRDGTPIRAAELNAAGAMTLLLKDALAPNLVQTLEGTPAFVHAGPFANIAHGCNSLIATRAGLRLGEIVVTEAGFGADLGAEKFFDIKCRVGGLRPEAAVVVATIRALKMHGGVPRAGLSEDNPDAVCRGVANLQRHVDNIRKFGVPPLIALNRFATDTASEIQAFLEAVEPLQAPVSVTDCHARGGDGALELARMVMDVVRGGEAAFKPLYPLDLPLTDKIELVAREIYGADAVHYAAGVEKELARFQAIGLREVPVCMAKTQYSFSDDPSLLGRPSGFNITVREVRPSAGAGFVVCETGEIMTMPGLPKRPAADDMAVGTDGRVRGLF